MTAIEALAELDALTKADPEYSHGRADAVIITFLTEHDPACKEVAEAWQRARTRCHFWYA